ncbi:hypothetical protein [Bradyrhizobium sp. WYCCWR 12699]|uniref:hypothetical protein n=1 Tax=Bradyrhizobium sp. WYCCWR 12699 TaxID=3064203 RepID=UPI0028A47410|nr:hypothetical protein [Bradyrhizobium sp. WYCCWR 12699]MDT4737247.1 hypothetical protein [Bradyrhizobium sp. WYCCWR 12699]
MLKPQARQTRRHWETLSDDQLLETELMTDDPENLPSLVYEIPPGDEEPYVEYKYDLRKSDREKFSCVHGHHQHLAGFVMRKGEARFLVGWICAGTIYGEDFDRYTADFDAAVVRQDALKRVREIRSAVNPFIAYLNSISSSDVFKHFNRLRGQLETQMPWVYDTLPAAAAMDWRVIGAALPKRLCASSTDVRQEFSRLMADFAAASVVLAGEPEKVAATIGAIRMKMDGLAKRVEAVLETLREVEDFFQPAALAAICKLANEHDNPKRRRYEAGLLSITCKRDRDKSTITMPKGFELPSRRPLEAFRPALAGMTT